MIETNDISSIFNTSRAEEVAQQENGVIQAHHSLSVLHHNSLRRDQE